VSHLFRHLAPVSEAAWEAVDDEATTSLRSFLAGRRLVDFTGPLGWDHNAIGTGRTLEPHDAGGVTVSRREVQPLSELRAGFTLTREALAAVDRGRADEADLDPVTEAARAMARTEDTMVFHGSEEAGVTGIVGASPHDPLLIETDYERYPSSVAGAVARLRESGIDGPYGLALGNRCYQGVMETTERGGYPVLEHLKLILGGPIVWAPEVDGALVVSQRGGDFELVCGQDLTVGYSHHDAAAVGFFIEESITFRAHEPAAAVWLRHQD